MSTLRISPAQVDMIKRSIETGAPIRRTTEPKFWFAEKEAPRLNHFNRPCCQHWPARTGTALIDRNIIERRPDGAFYVTDWAKRYVIEGRTDKNNGKASGPNR